MSYKVGDMVVYPRHGAAKVEAITERTVKGVTREYLQLSVLSSDGLVINVPVDNAKKVGVRDIVSASEVAKVFGILRTPIIEKEMNWSRRYKLTSKRSPPAMSTRSPKWFAISPSAMSTSTACPRARSACSPRPVPF